ncbi:PD-(D/E)XK nuclease family protein, partial [Salmonella enterica]|uniref:PD-(D/E)XK nuclease family protein n=1 Tax=Salmonella enterica TaxID=28901 RepID=UPI00329A75AC
PDFAKAFLGFCLKSDLKNLEFVDVKREYNNFDLFIYYKNNNEDNFIVIENKFKSIPTQKQLDEYTGKIET